jgi:hypothetical protein
MRLLPGLHHQHAQPNEGMAEKYGNEKDDEDKQHAELVAVDIPRY